MKKLPLCSLFALLLIAASAPAQTTWHVAIWGSFFGSGSASSPYPSIGQAVAAASNGDTVLVSPGTYLEQINFVGKAITIRSTDGAAGTTINAGASFHCVGIYNGETSTSVLRGFRLTNGNSIDGGGVLCVNTSPRIEDCIFDANVGVNYGGGLHCFGASPSLKRCRFTGNSSSIEGGGVSIVASSNVTLTDCVMTGNTTNWGGGATVNGSIANFVDCTFAGNIATADGGGLQVSGTSTVTLTRCTFSGNTADFGGGANCVGGTLNVLASTFVGNTGLTSGGGLAFNGCTANVASSLVVFNATNFGGGFEIANSTTSLVNVTIADNTASFNGGGIDLYSSPAPVLTNCIVWNNSPSAFFLNTGTSITVTRSDVQGGFVGVGNINANPGFVDEPNLDYHLAAGSPCLNVGSNTAPGLPAIDIDGNPRIRGGVVDLGADERAARLAGSNEDLLLTTPVAGAWGMAGTTPAAAGAAVSLQLTTPNGTFVTALPLIVGNLYANATPPALSPFFPTIQVDLNTLVVFYGGSLPPPFSGTLTSSGVTLGFNVPAGLSGFTLRIQGAVLSPLAANTSFATTDAHDLVF